MNKLLASVLLVFVLLPEVRIGANRIRHRRSNHRHRFTRELKPDKTNLTSLVGSNLTSDFIPECDPSLKQSKVLRMAVLLPTSANCEIDNDQLVYMEKVLPAIYLVADANATWKSGYSSPLKEILPGWRFEVWPRDTQCSSTFGPIESFRLHCAAGRASLNA